MPWLPTACTVGRAAIRATSTIAEPARAVLRLVLTSMYIFAQAILESQGEVLVLYNTVCLSVTGTIKDSLLASSVS